MESQVGPGLRAKAATKRQASSLASQTSLSSHTENPSSVLHNVRPEWVGAVWRPSCKPPFCDWRTHPSTHPSIHTHTHTHSHTHTHTSFQSFCRHGVLRLLGTVRDTLPRRHLIPALLKAFKLLQEHSTPLSSLCCITHCAHTHPHSHSHIRARTQTSIAPLNFTCRARVISPYACRQVYCVCLPSSVGPMSLHPSLTPFPPMSPMSVPVRFFSQRTRPFFVYITCRSSLAATARANS